MYFFEYQKATKAINEPRKSIVYSIARGGAYDNPLLRPDSANYSPVQNGILAHIKSRVITPFEGRFTPSLTNQYFFRPIKFEFEENGFEESVKESLLDQFCSVILPVLRILDPLSCIEDALSLTAFYLTNSILTFCQALYFAAKECIYGNEQETRQSVDHLKQSASNLIIALSMPVVGLFAAMTDTLRLVTRLIATVVDSISPLQTKTDETEVDFQFKY